MVDIDNEVSYFKIGTFVLVGIGLIIFSLLIFGSSKLFEPIVYVETYFDESIQGVSVGTPVKYRGLQIGYIKNIAFTSEVYKGFEMMEEKEATRSIYVKIAITSKLFTRLGSDGAEQLLSKAVANGLRIKLVAQGLTGISYLEFDYVDPKTNPIPKTKWEPAVFYVPSITSTLTRLSENAQYIMDELKDVEFKRMFADLHTLTISLNLAVNKAERMLNQIDNPLISTVQNLKVISDDLRWFSHRIKLKPSEVLFSSYPPILDPKKL